MLDAGRSVPASSPTLTAATETKRARPHVGGHVGRRHAIAAAVFERIDVPGANDFTFALTARARARGWTRPSGPASSA